MKKHHYLITRGVQDLICKIKKQWGHNHLYNDYKLLYDELEKNKTLSREEVYALDELVKILQEEADCYSMSYPRWAIRCLECSSELVFFLPSDYNGKEERIKKLAELLTSFITDTNLSSILFHRKYFRKLIDDVSNNDVEMLCEIALIYFRGTSAGRRPWGIKDEIAFYHMMIEGYKLANKYISLSGDFSHFPDWFSVLSPCRTDSIIEDVSNWIDNNEEIERKRWNHYS